MRRQTRDTPARRSASTARRGHGFDSWESLFETGNDRRRQGEEHLHGGVMRTRSCRQDKIDQLRDSLSHRQRRVIDDLPFSRAAVLVPLFEKEEDCHILFTKRTDQVTHHKGQISFPGGVFEKEDGKLERTALRETFEEIGLKERDIQLIGVLDDIVTITEFIVTPFVGIVPYPYPFQVSAIEIDELIEVPLTFLLDKRCFSERWVDEGNQKRIVYNYQYGRHAIWGATALILRQFLELLPSN
jgi:8-oxo-dGTP pyrophosphatase MutT (NUDIX family)